METVIVTRHQGLVEVLAEMGYTGKVISHATLDDVRGKVVIGVLPMHLASQTVMFGEVTLKLTPEQRGKELSAQEVRQAMEDGISWYMVRTEDQYEHEINESNLSGHQGGGKMTRREYVAHMIKHNALMASRERSANI
jgi:putative CRISPR-associated protein (TIGR02620 family)